MPRPPYCEAYGFASVLVVAVGSAVVVADRAAGRAGTEGADEEVGSCDAVFVGGAGAGVGAVEGADAGAGVAAVTPARSQGFGGDGMCVGRDGARGVGDGDGAEDSAK